MVVNVDSSDVVSEVVPSVGMLPLSDRMKGWNVRVSENADWGAYYKSQAICETDAEFELMKTTFQTPLPVAIRVNASAPFSKSVDERLKRLSDLEDSRPNKCQRLSWSQDGQAWQWSDISRVHVRKDPSLVELKKWLVDHESIGTLTRQEAVSMIPPLVLSLSPGDLVLDMCGAPGSKTCQMIEQIAGEGAVVANDVEYKRANMLSHQVQRLSSPANVITNVDACLFPTIPGGFNKILCDVPCTGDGTIRKAQDIWRRWTISEGLNIHNRQLQILLRGLQLLAPGGDLVYSTCSLNPIENEAVVAAALAKCPDVSLIPIPQMFGLEYRKALTKWTVWDDKTKTIQVSTDGSGKLRPTMYPPTDPQILSQLENGCRFLPHLMNSGGFFVAKFQKKISAKNIITKQPLADTPVFNMIDDALYANLVSFYSLDTVKVTQGQLFKRTDCERHVYFVSVAASRIVASCPANLKVVSVGVRAFAEIGKWHSPCPYRMTQEGIQALSFSANPARAGFVDLETFAALLETREVKTHQVSFPHITTEEVEGEDKGPIVRGGGVVYMETALGETIGLAVMISPNVVQTYADKLHCGWVSNIVKKE